MSKRIYCEKSCDTLLNYLNNDLKFVLWMRVQNHCKVSLKFCRHPISQTQHKNCPKIQMYLETNIFNT